MRDRESERELNWCICLWIRCTLRFGCTGHASRMSVERSSCRSDAYSTLDSLSSFSLVIVHEFSGNNSNSKHWRICREIRDTREKKKKIHTTKYVTPVAIRFDCCLCTESLCPLSLWFLFCRHRFEPAKPNNVSKICYLIISFFSPSLFACVYDVCSFFFIVAVESVNSTRNPYPKMSKDDNLSIRQNRFAVEN